MTTWPLNEKTPRDIFALTKYIITSSTIGVEYFNSINGLVRSIASVSDNPLDIISDRKNYGFAAQSVISLQEDDFARRALTRANYTRLINGYFDPRGFVSNIVLTMMTYGNTNNLSEFESDIITLWPRNTEASTMLTINDCMTYVIRRTTSNNNISPENIAEWRWMYPNRSRCVEPTADQLINIINIVNVSSVNAIYPNNAFKWDIFRYDTFNINVVKSVRSRNTLLSSNLPLSNDTVDIVYDNIAVPGCILLFLKRDVIINQREISSTYTIDGIVYPTVIRIGFEWISEFIDRNIIHLNGVSSTLRLISTSYLGCKRLYMWKLFYDLIQIRNQEQSSRGIYTCSFDRNNDYSVQWDDFFISGDKEITGTLNSVEIQAYIHTSSVVKNIPPNKYGDIIILSKGDNMINLTALECFNDDMCWFNYENTPDISTNDDKNYILFYVVVFSVFVIVLIISFVLFFYSFRNKIDSQITNNIANG